MCVIRKIIKIIFFVLFLHYIYTNALLDKKTETAQNVNCCEQVRFSIELVYSISLILSYTLFIH